MTIRGVQNHLLRTHALEGVVTMPGIPFRFLHASDFHLEQPLLGLSQVPDHLRDVLIDAPYVAAENVFDTALSQDVDFLILAGDVIHPRNAGPRGIELVRRHLLRLAERNIAVYWAAGTVDPAGGWPTAVPLPANVFRFEDGGVTAVEHRRGPQAVATLLGTGREGNEPLDPAAFDLESDSPFRIAVAHGPADAKQLREARIDYWALGGRHSAYKLFSERSIAQYCGSPQGRRETEGGLHGCTLVQVDEQGQAVCQMVPTDVVRWHNERIELTAPMTQADLERVLHDRTRHLSETNSARQLLVTWSVVEAEFLTQEHGETLASQLRRGSLADELVGRLRREFGMTSPGVWTAELDVVPPEELPAAWYEEDTILGDLLRLVRHYQVHEGEPLDRAWWASVGRSAAAGAGGSGEDLRAFAASGHSAPSCRTGRRLVAW